MRESNESVDYAFVAKVAERNGAPFERLCERAETKGARTEKELLGAFPRQPNERWLTTPQAAEYLNVSYSSLVSKLMKGDIDAFGIRVRSRSRVNPNARRGCGVLYNKIDLDEVKRIRRAISGSLLAALKVFQAKKRGLI